MVTASEGKTLLADATTNSAARWLTHAHISQLVMPLAVLTMVITFALASPFFWEASNFQNIARQAAGLSAVSVGQTFVVLTAGLDLSVGATVGLVSVVTAWAAVQYGLVVGVLFGIATGLAVGLVNGFVVARLGVTPVVATLAMLSIASGLTLIVSDGVAVSGLPPGFQQFATAQFLSIPVAALVSFALFLVAYAVLRWMKVGKYFYAIGGNAEAARLTGISVTKVLVSAYVLCSLFTAIGAMMLTARVNSGQPNLGGELLLQSIAAVVLGGVSLFGGRGSIVGVAFGVAFISILANGMNLLNVQSNVQMIIIGAALILAVAIDSFWTKRTGGK